MRRYFITRSTHEPCAIIDDIITLSPPRRRLRDYFSLLMPDVMLPPRYAMTPILRSPLFFAALRRR